MRRGRAARYLLSAVAWLALARPAHAHILLTGVDNLVHAVRHLILAPETVLTLLAAALLAGLRGESASRSAALAGLGAWLLATAFAYLSGFGADFALSTAVLLLMLGLFIAADLRLDATTIAAVAGLTGLLAGLRHGSAAAGLPLPFAAVMFALDTTILLIAWAAGYLVLRYAPWARIGVRVAGSWMAAIALLYFGWLLRGGGVSH
jgi:hydrogenase/urease accessory protein HupE